VINGQRYSIVSRLGEGGFAVVELVESSTNGRRYALKRVLLQSPDARLVCGCQVGGGLELIICPFTVLNARNLRSDLSDLVPHVPFYRFHFKLGELELTMLRKLDHPSIVRLHGSVRARAPQANSDELLMLLDYYPVRLASFRRRFCPIMRRKSALQVVASTCILC
jgi:serine/threonine protein kinase